VSAAAGIGRFADRLPAVRGEWITLGEGSTPVVALPRLGALIGVRGLRAKLETINPTGSYKDRIAAMSMTLARDRGQRGWIATSSGNAATALGAYGARAGLPGLLLVTPTIPREKLLPSQAVGPTVLCIDDFGTDGSADAAAAVFAAVHRAAEELDLFLGVTANAFNPDGMRGADTIGHELAWDGDADVVYVPTGGGGLSVCVARGLREAGATARVVVAQPSGCAPIAGVLEGRLDEPRVERCLTAISGLQLPLPPDGHEAVAAVRESGGWGTAIPDDAIWEAQRLLARHEGLLVEPAAAAGIAAIAHDVRTGRLEADACAIAVLTGSGSKDLSAVERWVGAPSSVSPFELEDAIARWAAAR
jgi:threonine synthase